MYKHTHMIYKYIVYSRPVAIGVDQPRSFPRIQAPVLEHCQHSIGLDLHLNTEFNWKYALELVD